MSVQLADEKPILEALNALIDALSKQGVDAFSGRVGKVLISVNRCDVPLLRQRHVRLHHAVADADETVFALQG